MSKSDTNPKNYVALLDEPKTIMKKVKSAVTDTGSKIKYAPEDPEKKGITNLVTIYSAITGRSMEAIEQEFDGKMYGHLKIAVGEAICEFIEPVQSKYKDLMNNKDYLHQLMQKNAVRANEQAQNTLKSVYEKVGFYPAQ